MQADIEAEMEKMMEKDPKGVKTLPTIFDFYTEVRRPCLIFAVFQILSCICWSTPCPNWRCACSWRRCCRTQ